MDQKEDVQNNVLGNDFLVKRDFDDFGMASISAAYLVIGRIGSGPAAVSANDAFNAFDAPIDRLGTPKTSSAQYKLCHIFIIRRYNRHVNDEEFKELISGKGPELFRPMPWRDNTDPYYVLVSELMLQQTQVDRVIPKFNAFIEAFPNASTLAEASLGDVLRLWSGLGYNRRAKYLHSAAQMITRDFEGEFPSEYAEILCLPGVGPGTAGAISVYAFNKPVVFIETNVRTVYFHHFFTDGDKVADSQLVPILERTIDKEHPREFYWALMDYGTWLKKNGAGKITQSRHYKKQSPLEGSIRQVRGQILRELSGGDLSLEELKLRVGADERFEMALEGVIKDGLVARTLSVLHLTK